MPGYVPPALRNNPKYTPKKLSIKQKPIEVNWENVKTTEQFFKEYQQENSGKADSAWDDN